MAILKISCCDIHFYFDKSEGNFESLRDTTTSINFSLLLQSYQSFGSSHSLNCPGRQKHCGYIENECYKAAVPHFLREGVTSPRTSHTAFYSRLFARLLSALHVS